jgi:hypothetical protein
MEKMNQKEIYGDVGIDPFDAPIPGESLTSDPEDQKPWEKPPEFTDINVALQDTFLQITEPDFYGDLMDMIRDDTPLDQITQMILFQGYYNGKWNTDLMMLLAEPVMYMLIGLAEHNAIYDYVVYEGEEDDMDDAEAAQLISDDADRMAPKRSKLSVAMNKRKEDVLPGSLLAQIEEVPTENMTDESALMSKSGEA